MNAVGMGRENARLTWHTEQTDKTCWEWEQSPNHSAFIIDSSADEWEWSVQKERKGTNWSEIIGRIGVEESPYKPDPKSMDVMDSGLKIVCIFNNLTTLWQIK